jgi:Ca2+-transporting ATPase
MSTTVEHSAMLIGLSKAEILQSRRLYGDNSIDTGDKNSAWAVVKGIFLEPMFILLMVACFIYVITENYQEAVMVIFGLVMISGISFIQERKSRSAIDAIRVSSAPKIKVLREGSIILISSDEVVVNDIMLIKEGDIAAADGEIISCNDLSANEAILSGESWPVEKDNVNNRCIYRGTMILSGTATLKVTDVGAVTKLGKIKKMVYERRPPKTPLQLKLKFFLQVMVTVGALAFAIVVIYSLTLSGSIMAALLTGLTLAMSIFPEEIPVAIASFQALGAFRLLRKNVIVKYPQYVETLGSATTICVDKTGTLTLNLMEIASFYDAKSDTTIRIDDPSHIPLPLLEASMWASETVPFDPMEKSIHQLYTQLCKKDLRSLYSQVYEYPLSGHPPLMTHIQSGQDGNIIIAAKGAPEALIRQSRLPDEKKKALLDKASYLAAQGHRVLAVGIDDTKYSTWPESQQNFSFLFLGFIAFADPLKENIPRTISHFLKAGVKVKMITGDYPQTSLAIAKSIGLNNTQQVLTGDQVIEMTETNLRTAIKGIDIFARMQPEAKVKVISALIANGEVVAMTGDGVNDAPSLKAAHIGVAMGVRGSAVAKDAAAIIVSDDNIAHIVDAIESGRKIYDNLQKGIRYIVSIHIPIIMIVMLPLLLHWQYSNLFTPVHVIFLELIMGPTCSIIYENEPSEPGIMDRTPRPANKTFLSLKQLALSLIQGLVITAGCLGIGYWYMNSGRDLNSTRSIIFITLLLSNLLLTLVNRSFTQTVTRTIKYKNPFMTVILIVNLAVISAIWYWMPLTELFGVSPLSITEIALACLTASVSTLWTDIYKIFRHTG